MTSKAMDLKRLGIYLLLVFAASITLILFHKVTNESRTAFFLVQQLFCWSPAIACIVTRAVTGEGFRDMKLHLRLKGNWGYYLLAFALPLIFVPVTKVLPIVLNGHTERLDGFTWTNIAAAVLQLGSAAAVGSIGLLGEELGWRGYMNEKMELLLGTSWTCLAGGAVWGLWHFPNDIQNWLNGYVSFPSALQNAFERMVILIMLGVILMWVTKKTDSVLPAVVLHFTYNSTIGVIDSLTAAEGQEVNVSGEIVTKICEFAPPVLLGAVFLAMMVRGDMKRNKSE